MSEVIGTSYCGVIRPDPGEYPMCRYSRMNRSGDLIVGVYQDVEMTEDGPRPVYNVVVNQDDSGRYDWGQDYDPNTGLWHAGSYGLTSKQVQNKARGLTPLRGFVFTEGDE